MEFAKGNWGRGSPLRQAYDDDQSRMEFAKAIPAVGCLIGGPHLRDHAALLQQVLGDRRADDPMVRVELHLHGRTGAQSHRDTDHLSRRSLRIDGPCTPARPAAAHSANVSSRVCAVRTQASLTTRR
eukprot:3893895-Pyramimonas_sp.AAC.2